MKVSVLCLAVLVFILAARECTSEMEADVSAMQKSLVYVTNNDDSIGSGFILSDGYVMTCAHILPKKKKRGEEVKLNVFPVKAKYEKRNPKTEIVYVNYDRDILILKVPWVKGSVRLQQSQPYLGQEVVTVGYTDDAAEGYIFWGRVARLNLKKGTIDLDLNASFGASGSAVYDARTGELVGMVDYIKPLGYGPVSPTVIGMIPASALQATLPFIEEVPWGQFIIRK